MKIIYIAYFVGMLINIALQAIVFEIMKQKQIIAGVQCLDYLNTGIMTSDEEAERGVRFAGSNIGIVINAVAWPVNLIIGIKILIKAIVYIKNHK